MVLTIAKYDDKKIDQLAKEQIALLEQTITFTKSLISSNALTAEAKNLYQAALAELLEYQKNAAGVLDIVSSDLNIATMYMGTADDKFQSLSKNLKGLSDRENRLAKEQYDFSSKSYTSLLRIFIVILIVAIVLSLLISIVMVRYITGPIKEVIEGLTGSSDQVTAASEELSSSSQALSEGASEQASSLEETSSSIEEMASMIKHNAENSNHANVLMTDTITVVDEANTSMAQLSESMREISSASEETAKIIKTIDEIAFQTNLLALNAAVEAARAGEAGAGFAVVADEVRNLALRAADAARNTATLIEETVRKVKKGSDIVSITIDAFAKLAMGAKKVGEIVSEISSASNQQAEGIDQINTAVAEMDKVVQQNAANAEESAAASGVLNTQAAQMKVFVGDLVRVVGGNGHTAISTATGTVLQRD